MRKWFTLGALALAMTIPAAATAAYGQQPGFEVASAATPCAGHGAFGAFGTQGDVVHDFGVNYPGSNGAPGASGYQTGLNNSALCGNRQ